MHLLIAQLELLRNEINCRLEHGAEGAEHLKFIEDRLKAIMPMAHRVVDTAVIFKDALRQYQKMEERDGTGD